MSPPDSLRVCPRRTGIPFSREKKESKKSFEFLNWPCGGYPPWYPRLDCQLLGEIALIFLEINDEFVVGPDDPIGPTGRTPIMYLIGRAGDYRQISVGNVNSIV